MRHGRALLFRLRSVPASAIFKADGLSAVLLSDSAYAVPGGRTDRSVVCRACRTTLRKECLSS